MPNNTDLITLPIKSTLVGYLRRKFHEAAKDLRRRKRYSAYESLSGEDLLDYYMLEGLAAQFEELKGSVSEQMSVTFTYRQLKYLEHTNRRLWKLLTESDDAANQPHC